MFLYVLFFIYLKLLLLIQKSYTVKKKKSKVEKTYKFKATSFKRFLSFLIFVVVVV